MYMPSRLGPAVVVSAFLLTVLSTIVVGLRFCCRLWVVGKPKCYDYIILIALVLTWVMAILNNTQVIFGTGTHMVGNHLDNHMLVGYLKSWYSYHIIYLLDIFTVKLSLLLFYRSFATRPPFRLAVDCTLAIVTIFTVVMFFVDLCQCPKHLPDAWSVDRYTTKDNQCFNLMNIYYVQAAFNIASDIWILLLPLPTILGLQMHKKKRLAVIGIFSVGSVAAIASIIRLWALTVFQNDASNDSVYCSAHILIWSQFEINCAIMSASFPSLKPLYKKFVGGSSIQSRASRPRTMQFECSGERSPAQSKIMGFTRMNDSNSNFGSTTHLAPITPRTPLTPFSPRSPYPPLLEKPLPPTPSPISEPPMFPPPVSPFRTPTLSPFRTPSLSPISPVSPSTQLRNLQLLAHQNGLNNSAYTAQKSEHEISACTAHRNRRNSSEPSAQGLGLSMSENKLWDRASSVYSEDIDICIEELPVQKPSDILQKAPLEMHNMDELCKRESPILPRRDAWAV